MRQSLAQRIPWLVFGLLVLAGPASAQLTLTLSAKHTEYLLCEDIRLKLVLQNDTKQPFVVARDAKAIPELQFVFEKPGLTDVARAREGLILKDLWIIPGTKEEVEINLGDWYNLSRMGQYLLKAVVTWNGKEYQSNQVVLEIVRGMQVASVAKGVPGDKERVRTYSLRYWRRDRVEHLFLCVSEEATGDTYGVFPLGPVVRVQKPQIEVTDEGDVKIRHQCSATCFIHTLLKSTPRDIRLVKRTFHLENGDPYPAVEGGEDKPRP